VIVLKENIVKRNNATYVIKREFGKVYTVKDIIKRQIIKTK